MLFVMLDPSSPLLQWAAGLAAGVALTALALFRHERKVERAVNEAAGQLRRSEARIQALVRNSHDVIAVLDRDGVLKFASPAAERAFGKPVGQLLDAPPFDFVHPDDRTRVMQVFLSSLARPGAVSPTVEFRV